MPSAYVELYRRQKTTYMYSIEVLVHAQWGLVFNGLPFTLNMKYLTAIKSCGTVHELPSIWADLKHSFAYLRYLFPHQSTHPSWVGALISSYWFMHNSIICMYKLTYTHTTLLIHTHMFTHTLIHEHWHSSHSIFFTHHHLAIKVFIGKSFIGYGMRSVHCRRP